MVKNIDPAAIKAVREKYQLPEDKDARLLCGAARQGKERGCAAGLLGQGDPSRRIGIHLMVIGDGPVREELEQQARDLGITDMVLFTGAIPHAELPPYLAVCDVYVTASLSDTNSISMLEGEAAGLPALQRTGSRSTPTRWSDGDNGYHLQHRPRNWGSSCGEIQTMSREDLLALKDRTTRFVKNGGAENLANYTLSVYHAVYKDRLKQMASRPELLQLFPLPRKPEIN